MRWVRLNRLVRMFLQASQWCQFSNINTVGWNDSQGHSWDSRQCLREVGPPMMRRQQPHLCWVGSQSGTCSLPRGVVGEEDEEAEDVEVVEPRRVDMVAAEEEEEEEEGRELELLCCLRVSLLGLGISEGDGL